MSLLEPLCCWLGINPSELSRKEIFSIETEMLRCLCEELKEIFRKEYKEYFYLMKFTREQEDMMLTMNLVAWMIRDILSTEEYNYKGIACYIDVPEEVVRAVASGCNQDPSAILLQKVMILHGSVKRDLYRVLLKKIVAELE